MHVSERCAEVISSYHVIYICQSFNAAAIQANETNSRISCHFNIDYTNLKSMISTRNIKLNQNEKRANCQTKKLQAPTRRASARSESALLTDEGTTHDPSRLSMRPIHYTTFG
ncbi:hypothetical protein SFRURICE_005234 [Spodoptera frugiperda]|nr:hypothetical protein SFRURICE_005234 [Spodoptera frugiperda]